MAGEIHFTRSWRVLLRARELNSNRMMHVQRPASASLRGLSSTSASAEQQPQDACPMTERVQAVEVMACLVTSSSDVF
jgi:hypothetical protein